MVNRLDYKMIQFENNALYAYNVHKLNFTVECVYLCVVV